ncbi:MULTISPECIES: 2-dehydropantoate 2-reductase [unclassified Beijerinckia]|uniref:ketopantoate reductase family protein n=1 Tax=unclassified Beijerinckia TaxID=2638183 RepID=UPI0008956C07|nr:MULTISPECIES: 2-dehydropantoate 2-reductase [unclassified Beijerinckia]SEB50084.1 ketopantoate reductase [Beijerinckia sp. 28-YEA-48]
MKFAVVGAGAVGCYFGALLARTGHDVCLIGRPTHVEAIARHGLRLESKLFDGHVPMQATTEISGVEDADVVLFCVKSSDTEATGRMIAPHLKPDATILCLQNGVDNAERLSAVLKQTVLPTAVYVATEMAGPGHVRHYGRGELIIGASAPSPRIADVLSEAKIPTTVSADVISALWTKLVANCSYNALSAVSQLPYGRLIEIDGVRDTIRNTIDECMTVANAAGITLPANIHDLTFAIATDMAGQRSSTAQDLARGKPTEIDHLNGYVVRKGRQLGIPTPINLLLQTMVKLKETEQKASP